MLEDISKCIINLRHPIIKPLPILRRISITVGRQQEYDGPLVIKIILVGVFTDIWYVDEVELFLE